jgi:hypothetical protein
MSLDKEKWFKMPLFDQLGNLGSEVGRSAKWQNKDEKSFWGAVTRALEIFDVIREDGRWKKRLLEINRAREIFADAVLGGSEYGSKLSDVEKYFMQFALAARADS